MSDSQSTIALETGMLADQFTLCLWGRAGVRVLSGRLQIEILLKLPEDLSDLRPQVGYGIGDRVVILQTQQRRQLLTVSSGEIISNDSFFRAAPGQMARLM
jgi:hypothetical protein